MSSSRNQSMAPSASPFKKYTYGSGDLPYGTLNSTSSHSSSVRDHRASHESSRPDPPPDYDLDYGPQRRKGASHVNRAFDADDPSSFKL